MSTLFLYKYPEDFYQSLDFACAVMSCADEIAAYMVNTSPRWSQENARMTFYIILRDIRSLRIMPRKKVTNGTNKPSQPDTKRLQRSNDFRWVTVRLEAEDVAWLAECTDDMAAIVVPLFSLCERGIGFTCKPQSSGDGFCATLLSQPTDDQPYTIGLSAFGGTVRDTCLALLYKFDHLLGGQFPTNTDAFNNAKPRFG